MSELFEPVLAPVLALGFGAASALLPILNTEVYALATAGRAQPGIAAVVVVALAVGQTAGKLALFEAARRGTRRLPTKKVRSCWSTRIRTALSRRRTATPLVLTSAAIGLPPLAAVCLAAGAAGQPRWEFGLACLVGRTARFTAIALPVAWALR